MKLKELLTGIPVLECTADPELEIKEIFYDSRKVTPGSLFVAVSGFAADGNKFIPMAAERPEPVKKLTFLTRMASACRIKSYLLWGLRLWTIRSILYLPHWIHRPGQREFTFPAASWRRPPWAR